MSRAVVYLRFPRLRNGFENPENVIWNEEREKELWKLLNASSNPDWGALAARFDVSVQYILQQASWLYELELGNLKHKLSQINLNAGLNATDNTKDTSPTNNNNNNYDNQDPHMIHKLLEQSSNDFSYLNTTNEYDNTNSLDNIRYNETNSVSPTGLSEYELTKEQAYEVTSKASTKRLLTASIINLSDDDDADDTDSGSNYSAFA